MLVLRFYGRNMSDYEINFDTISLKCDNKNAICLSKNFVLHSKSKHIDVHNHFLRNHVEKNNIQLIYTPTKNQADIFTKPLEIESFSRIKRSMRICDQTDF